jgi:hypothetical protein
MSMVRKEILLSKISALERHLSRITEKPAVPQIRRGTPSGFSYLSDWWIGANAIIFAWFP